MCARVKLAGGGKTPPRFKAKLLCYPLQRGNPATPQDDRKKIATRLTTHRSVDIPLYEKKDFD